MHIREMHTGERPYVCEEPGCGADFSRPWCLYRHQRSKHGGESTDQVHVGHKRRKHRGVSTDQVLVAQEDVDMNENEMENDGDDNDYAPYSHSEGMLHWPPTSHLLTIQVNTDHVTSSRLKEERSEEPAQRC